MWPEGPLGVYTFTADIEGNMALATQWWPRMKRFLFLILFWLFKNSNERNWDFEIPFDFGNCVWLLTWYKYLKKVTQLVFTRL